MRLLGLDPGLRNTGWGVIESDGYRLRHVANGVVSADTRLSLAERLATLHEGLVGVIDLYRPVEAAVEETFVNNNPSSTLKLGQARGIAMLVPAQAGLPVAEYTPNMIKKTVVGAGHAAKEQIQMMVSTLLPGITLVGPDSADALAVAICHAHHRQTAAYIKAATVRRAVVGG